MASALLALLDKIELPAGPVTGVGHSAGAAILARDRMIPPRDAYRLQGHIPGSTLDVVDKAGHLAHEEVPEDIARLILSYSACEQDAHLAYPNTGDVHVTAARA